MKIEPLEVYGFIGMLESLRLPYKKECRSSTDGNYKFIKSDNFGPDYSHVISTSSITFLHEDDLKLLQKLIKAGDEHAKCLRLLGVNCKIKTSRYIWSELDTYEVGVVNGCSESTMHTILNEELTLSHFDKCHPNYVYLLQKDIREINKIKEDCELTTNERIMLIKNLLPESYLQERVISFSYQTLQRMYYQRCIIKHRLPQWESFGKFVESLPLSKELITGKFKDMVPA